MKKTSPLLLAIGAIIMAAPCARAYQKDPWHYPWKVAKQLDERMEVVDTMRDRWGGTPKMLDQVTLLNRGLHRLEEHVRGRFGDPEFAHARADELNALMTQVEIEYRQLRHHEQVEIRMDRAWERYRGNW